MVILTDDDFADLPLTSSRAIDVLEFVPAEQVDPILYNKAYYLEPEGAAAKPYVLLRDALTDSERVAIVKVALRQREQLATLRVRDGVLVLNTMLWPDEVRAADVRLPRRGHHRAPAELAMAALADRLDGRPTSTRRVHRRLPRGAAGGHRRQGGRPGDRRPAGGRGGADRRGRPDGRAAGVGRAGQGRARRRRTGARPEHRRTAGRADPDHRGPVGQEGRRPRRPARGGQAAKKAAAAAKTAPEKAAAGQEGAAAKQRPSRGEEGRRAEEGDRRRRRRAKARKSA